MQALAQTSRRAHCAQVALQGHRRPRARPVACRAASSAKSRVREAVDSGCDVYSDLIGLESDIKALIAENPTSSPGYSASEIGQGSWQVFSAPHIAGFSKPVGIRFSPIRYHLDGSRISSNVRFEGKLPGVGKVAGWLSAAGTFSYEDDTTVRVDFNDFWYDPDESLRMDVDSASRAAARSSADNVITQMGRLAFFPQFSKFPVLYLDDDICVFKFPPLDSAIACARIKALPEGR
ncbi:unnamed protein product [Pedinophyceae sp. YPF-701]|nr:unnamed protein product [Pedinophyceae sp. YPF-701]